MSKEEKMRAAFSNILYVKEGIRIAPKDLRSTKADRVLSEEYLEIIASYKEYFDKIEEIVEFIDDIRNPTGIFKFVREYAYANGLQHTKKIEIKGKIVEIDDWYEPNDPEEYVMVFIDHISLIQAESSGGKQMSQRESIAKLSSDYLIRLRNKYNYIPVVVQQQAAAQESVDNMKVGRLKPTLDGLGDNKTTQRDANVILGLFSPFRHEIPEYFGYDIKYFKDNIRFLEILGGREGGGGTTCPLYFDGAVNYFKELPKSNDAKGMEGVYKFLNSMRQHV